MLNNPVFRFVGVAIMLVVAMINPAKARSVDLSRVPVLEREIRAAYDSLNLTALGIAVVKDDSIVYQKSFGFRVLPDSAFRGGELLENDDLFRIASISKTFVATAIMRLQEDGLLDVDDAADKYLKFDLKNPYYPDVPISIRNLLTHTSSLNDSRSWWTLDHLNPSEGSEYVKCYNDKSPGTDYKYCNLNYVVLAAVIEGATGRRFDDEIERIIMSPLGLKAGYNPNRLDTAKFVQNYYRKKDSQDILRRNAENFFLYKKALVDYYVPGKLTGLLYPSDGMKISVGDLARYMMMHINNGEFNGERIISPESEMKMQTNYVGRNNYGFSFRTYKQLIPGRIFHGQTGGNQGAKTAMIFDSDDKSGVVILTSGADVRDADGFSQIHTPIIRAVYNTVLADEH